MSKEAFIRFRDAVMQSSSLQAELADTVKSQADLVAIGKRLGFEFDAADLESPELTEQELGQAVGGEIAVDHRQHLGRIIAQFSGSRLHLTGELVVDGHHGGDGVPVTSVMPIIRSAQKQSS